MTLELAGAVPAATRRCHMCEKTLPLEEFHIQRRTHPSGKVWIGREYRCKACSYTRHRNWVERNPDRSRQLDVERNVRKPGRFRERNLKQQYGMSLEDYEKMNDAQGGLCAICGQPEKYHTTKNALTPKRLAVDHCHKTGKIRRLLCANCNRALGQFQEDVTILRAAIAYLEQHTESP